MSAGTRRYCTYFDSHFLARGITMLRSLRRWDPDASILVLALDDLCARVVSGVFGRQIEVLRQSTLLAADEQLEASRQGRSEWAFYATHKPAFLLYTLLSEPSGASVIFIDADTWFFSDPEPILTEMRNASIGLSPHRFSEGNGHLSKYGIYNAGFIYLRVNEEAIDCMTRWRSDCLAWCNEQALPDGRFMNQGYLNRWPEQYAGVRTIEHPGANLAPWNVNGHRIERTAVEVLVDGKPLIFYHFSSVHRDEEGNWYAMGNQSECREAVVVEAIYEPYAGAVEAETELLLKSYGVKPDGSVREVTLGPGAIRIYPRPLGRN